MRIAVISDVHANMAALDAVLRHAGAIDGVWCLGDSVGYGPQPVEVVRRLAELDVRAVAGNHDRAATGSIGVEEFNSLAATAALWTRERLGPDEIAFLDGLPEVAHLAPDGSPAPDGEAAHTLVHGTLRWPIWEYLYSHEAAAAHLERQTTPFSFVGHTHVPMLVREGDEFPDGCELYAIEEGAHVPLTGDRKLVFNPGSVGQPRDGDPRAAYALLDGDEGAFGLHRVEYDVSVTQKLMAEAGLPEPLIARLSLGR